MSGDAISDGEVVRLWVLSRICEEFHVTPDVAEELWLDEPRDQVRQMLELRSYAAAKQAYDAAGGKLEQLDQSPMMDEVIENVFAVHKERLAERD